VRALKNESRLKIKNQSAFSVQPVKLRHYDGLMKMAALPPDEVVHSVH